MKTLSFLGLLALTASITPLQATPSTTPPPSTAGNAAVFDIRNFGAKADGQTLNTAAIQSAINKAHAMGGGIVHVPAGLYRSGTLELLSGVTLNLAKGATVRGSDSLADYRRGHWPALLMAKDQQHIGVTGEGTLDGNSQVLEKLFATIRESGNGLAFFPNTAPGQKLDIIGPTGVPTIIDPHTLQAEGKLIKYLYGTMTRPYEFVRPQVIEFWGCRNITIRDITLANAACWVETYRDCEDILIERLKVRSTDYWNNDGIDLVDCRRVKMIDCDIDSADDALCLKSDPRGEGCADITVNNCKLASRASAVKFGTASHHGFKRIHISDLQVRDTYRSVVAIQSVDGAEIEDVTVERVKATNTGNAFFIRLGHRTQSKPPGSIHNIILRDMDVVVRPEHPGEHMDVNTPHNQIPSSIVGLPNKPVESILLENIKVRFPGGAKREKVEIKLDALGSVPENARDYPEFSMWGELPAWGVYIRHAKHVTLRNVQFSLDAPDFRPAIVADDAPGLCLDKIKVGPGGGEPVVIFKDSPDADLRNPSLPEGTKEPLRVLQTQR
jgi:polygalacturonase